MISTLVIGANLRKPPATASRRRLETPWSDDLASSALTYVNHPSFPLASTGKALWGPECQPIDVPPFDLGLAVEDEDLTAPTRIPRRLSNEEEKTLFLRYNYAKYQLCKLQRLQQRRPSRQTARDVELWRGRAAESRTALAHANMPLVPAMTRYVKDSGAEITEMVSEGYMAVLRCIEKFDVSRGFKFSTYACRAIIAQFRRMAMRASRRRERFLPEFDLATEESRLDERKHETQRSDAISTVREILRRNLAGLSQDELAIVNRRFLKEAPTGNATLAQVGKALGLSPERVRQIEKASLVKIRLAFEDHFAA